MAAQDEKDPRDATVAMSADELPGEGSEATKLVERDVDPEATKRVEPDAERDVDPEATKRVEPDPTQLVDEAEAHAADAAATQLAADPDATQRADAAETRPSDPGETRAADAAPTTVVPPAARGADDTAAAPDGIDAMDSPYYSPATIEDLTSAQAPVSIESPVQSLPERRHRLPRWAMALLAVVLVVAVAGVAWYTYDQELWGGKTVPSVVGMSQDEAVEELEDLGFAVSVESVLADDSIGIVLSCSPNEGQRVDPADGITLRVAVQRVIPQVVGLDVEDAQEALVYAGALSISISYQNSDEAAGTVLSVSPGEGEAFSPSDQVTLVVARAYTVPDVLGMSLEDAQAELSAGGLSSSVTYVRSDDEKNTVVAADPGVGAQVEPGATIALSVATTLPSTPYDLLAYFDAIPQALPAYLEEQGFSLSYGGVYASGGNARAAYTGESGDLLQVSNSPESGRYSGDSQADVLSRGAGVGGVRYAFSSETLPSGADVESVSGVRAVMAACGLEGLLDTCTQDDIVMPEETVAEEESASEDATADEEQTNADASTGADDTDGDSADEGADDEPEPVRHFICGYGRQGDYTWAVIIGGYDDVTRVVALAVPTSHFDGIDLSSYGGSVCDYIAYIDQYTG